VALLETINLALSSPPLTDSALQASKVYLFLIPTTSGGATREKIVGCVIAQRIATAMALASPDESVVGSSSSRDDARPSSRDIVQIDSTTPLFVQPTPLPTPMGISRLFVARSHRRSGIAMKLLSAASETFIHGCKLDPKLGQVAFTQPTRAGAAVMREWGNGGVRIYEE